MDKPEIIWDVTARNSLKKQIDHIKKDSLQAAQKVRDDIFDIIDELATNPL